MAREVKPVKLKTIDDGVVETTPVVRLENRETEGREKDLKPVRLGASEEETEISRRLGIPAKDEVELRTHQPGIEVLIEQDAPNPDLLEEKWGEQSARRHPIPWGWFALIGLAIAGAVVWSLTRVEKADKVADQLRVKTVTTIVDEAKEEREAGQLIDRIEKCVRDYFDSTTADQKARYVRHAQRVLPLMRHYYASHPVSAAKVTAIKTLQPVSMDNRGNFWMSSVNLGNHPSQSLIIEIDPSGKPLVDWETLVCYQPMPWDEFVTRRPAGKSMDFRVYVEPDNFYSHEFSNSRKWTSYRLTALDSEETLFGYALVGSSQALALKHLIDQNGGRRASLILRLQIPEQLASRRGVVIEDVLSPRWMYLDSPDSGS